MEPLKIMFWISETRIVVDGRRAYPRPYFHHLISNIRALTDVGFPSKDIIVYLTPANQITRAGFVVDNCVDGQHVNIIRSLGVDLRIKQNLLPGHEYPYSNRLYVCEVESPSVLSLDLDGCIWKDPRVLLDGDFDFAGRANPYSTPKSDGWKQDVWEDNCRRFGMGAVAPCLSAGCIIFKNWAHKRIRETWLDYQVKHLRREIPAPFGDDLFASEGHTLTWAVLRCVPRERIWWLTGREYAIGDDIGRPYMAHGGWNYPPSPSEFIPNTDLIETPWEVPEPIAVG
jgi:hypothetical protein